MILALWRVLWEAFYPIGFKSLCNPIQLRLCFGGCRTLALAVLFELAQQVRVALVLAAALGMLQGGFFGRAKCVRRLIGGPFDRFACLRFVLYKFARFLVVAPRGLIVAFALHLVSHARFLQLITMNPGEQGVYPYSAAAPSVQQPENSHAVHCPEKDLSIRDAHREDFIAC